MLFLFVFCVAFVHGAENPAAPTITHVEGSDKTATVFFDPGFDGGSPITSFTALSSPGGFIGSSFTSPIVVEGLQNGQVYTFSVLATSAVGTSAFSQASMPIMPVPGGTTAPPPSDVCQNLPLPDQLVTTYPPTLMSGELAGNELRIQIQINHLQGRRIEMVQLLGSGQDVTGAECSFPVNWVESARAPLMDVASNQMTCSSSFMSHIPWPRVTAPVNAGGCALRKEMLTDAFGTEWDIFSGVVRVVYTDNIASGMAHRTSSWLRTSTSTFAMSVRLQKTITVTSALLGSRIYDEANLDAAVVRQTSVDTPVSNVQVAVGAVVQYPFKLKRTTLTPLEVAVPQPSLQSGSLAIQSPDCNNIAGSLCTQEVLLSITPAAQLCSMSGVYTVSLELECWDSVECPLRTPADRNVELDLRLDMENFCTSIDLITGLSGNMATFSDPFLTTQAAAFLTSQYVYYKATLVSEVAIEQNFVDSFSCSSGGLEQQLMINDAPTSLGMDVSVGFTSTALTANTRAFAVKGGLVSVALDGSASMICKATLRVKYVDGLQARHHITVRATDENSAEVQSEVEVQRPLSPDANAHETKGAFAHEEEGDMPSTPSTKTSAGAAAGVVVAVAGAVGIAVGMYKRKQRGGVVRRESNTMSEAGSRSSYARVEPEDDVSVLDEDSVPLRG